MVDDDGGTDNKGENAAADCNAAVTTKRERVNFIL